MEAETLATLIRVLEESFPGIEDRVVDERGLLRPYVNVFINGELVRRAPSEVGHSAGDVVHILPSVAGG